MVTRSIPYLVLAIVVSHPVVAQDVPARKPVELTDKTRQATEALKANLGTFGLTLSVNGSAPSSLTLVTDPKAVRATRGEKIFLISEKQASSIIDHLAAVGRLERNDVPVPGIQPPGWYLYVTRKIDPKKGAEHFWGIAAIGPEARDQETIKFLRTVLAENKEALAALDKLLEDFSKNKK